MNLVDEFIEFKSSSKGTKRDTLEAYKRDIDEFQKFIGKNFLEIEENDILKYIERLKKEYSKNSIIRKISSLRVFFKYLFKKNLIDIVPTTGINIEKAKETKKEILENWEINAVLDTPNENEKDVRDKLLIRVLVETGITINEALKLRVSQLEFFSYKHVSIDDNKEIIEIDSKLGERIKNYIKNEREKIGENQNSDLLFSGLTRQNFRARIINLGKRANLDRVISTSMIRNNIKEKVIKKDNIIKEKMEEIIRKKYFEIGIGDD